MLSCYHKDISWGDTLVSNHSVHKPNLKMKVCEDSNPVILMGEQSVTRMLPSLLQAILYASDDPEVDCQ